MEVCRSDSPAVLGDVIVTESIRPCSPRMKSVLLFFCCFFFHPTALLDYGFLNDKSILFDAGLAESGCGSNRRAKYAESDS